MFYIFIYEYIVNYFRWSSILYLLSLIRYRVPMLLSMSLVPEQVTGLLSYPVHQMKPKQRRAFSKHLFLVAHDISPLSNGPII